MIFDQAEFDVRLEWGEVGVQALAPISDVVIVVDILSFSTAVDIATARGARVFPYKYKDDTVHDYAAPLGAVVADGRNPAGYSLSPASLQTIPEGLRVVLPSPNGSTLSLLVGNRHAVAGCLRNCKAVAEAALAMGSKVSVIPAGERWPDGSLRPCYEDLVGAGGIISHLSGSLSPEASTALAAFNSAADTPLLSLDRCSSGKEKVERGEAEDVRLAAEIDVSDCVPLLVDGAFIRQA